ncbi:hypothetical protein FKW77_009872 [Venturia effusa]|uniref:Uncharacterized protein n=1 Tax=Venturia effusa TaxID=50376 RepID=A0A517L257_9PEZI|nr:hypothetical protein FKW77_009872 [Venturia effusa]
MSPRTRACQLLGKRWLASYVQSRTFTQVNTRYNQVLFTNKDESNFTNNHSDVSLRSTPKRTEELEKRARILQSWQDQLEQAQLEEEIARMNKGKMRGNKEDGNGLKVAQDSELRHATTHPPIWRPGRPVIRKVMIDETIDAIAGAARYYLKPRKGKALRKAEEQAAKDPMLQYALSPDRTRLWGEELDLALDRAVQIGKGDRQLPSRAPVTGPENDESIAEARRIQAENHRRRQIARNLGRPRKWQLQLTSLSFMAAVNRWKDAHLPQPIQDRHKYTKRVLVEVSRNWVESLEPRFTRQQIADFTTELAVFSRVMNERYHRRLQQGHPRLYLQYKLLNSSMTVALRMKQTLQDLDSVLEADSSRETRVGKDCEVYAQKIDFCIVDLDAMSEEFIPQLARYVENLSDEEVACKVQSFVARAASNAPPYFDPTYYSGTIDPVFWPRAPRLGI